MNDFLNTIFGLASDDTIGFGSEGAYFDWARPIPAWGWALIIAAAITLSITAYRNLIAPRTPRAALAAVRTATLILLAVLAAGPQLIKDNERTETDWLAILVDRSASLTVPDATSDTSPTRTTREQALTQALNQNADTFAQLAEDKRVLWLGFDAGAYELNTTDTNPIPDLGQPDGSRTSLDAAFQAATRRLAARPVSGYIVLSDGRSADTVNRETLRRLRGERAPIIAVPLGAEGPLQDLAVERIEAPDAAFTGDVAPVRVQLAASSDAAAQAAIAAGATLRIIDQATGLEVDTKELTEEDLASGEVTLTPRPDTTGSRTWQVVLDPGPADLIETNNTRELSIELFEGPIRVLYIDGSPRWENRYLKNLLLRESSITSSSLILASDRRFQQEGDVVLDRLPTTREAWNEFDVVIIGDVRSSLFSREQLEELRRHVAENGAGILWLAGPGHTPQSWTGAALADLIPITLATESRDTQLQTWDESVTLLRTPAADNLGLLDLSNQNQTLENEIWAGRVADPATGWSRLRWAQRINPDALKPATEVLALARPASLGPITSDTEATTNPDLTPLVLQMRFGAGRSLYVATDEIWRYRYGRGEDLNERFWLPLIRSLARERLSRSGRRAIITATPERAAPGQPVRVRVELIDQALIDAAATTIRARVRTADTTFTTTNTLDQTIELAPDGPRAFAATFIAERAGEYTASTNDPLLAGIPLEAPFELIRPDDELRRPATDHPRLQALAQATDGQLLPLDQLDQLPEILPNRERVVTANPDIATLWDSAPALAALLLLLATEWAGRRLIKLA